EVGESPGGGDVPRGEGGEGRRVEPDGIPGGSEEGPVLVDQEDDLRGGVHQQLPQGRKKRLVLRLPEDETPVAHRRKDTTCPPFFLQWGYPRECSQSGSGVPPVFPTVGVPQGA